MCYITFLVAPWTENDECGMYVTRWKTYIYWVQGRSAVTTPLLLSDRMVALGVDMAVGGGGGGERYHRRDLGCKSMINIVILSPPIPCV